MKEKNLRLKKHLGQHFLINESITQEIVNLLPKDKQFNLLEVGPGAGALTKYLLQLENVNYKAIEADEEKVQYLVKTFPNHADKFLLGSFLDMDLPFEEEFIIIGNFPYNISSQIMFQILDWIPKVTQVIGMFQKEVAQRIVAEHGSKDIGILSVFTACFFKRHYHFDVPPEDFNPPPKVYSGVIKLDYIGNKYHIEDYPRFKKFVKILFSKRRKTLRNVLKPLLSSEILSDSFFDYRIEQISISEIVDLYKQHYEK
ncbi:MAG TPA: 16S rRNA (adenine(1518)-N(6)/adenine(1519)-N(6))-dimethyltransferase RsmA [Chitinophagaceae bacterium]|nr:16S rRNA (adenine(1518)-N(6)/adenine(1519)-N(6))-dimethyltransferase RsmA [Chitinophagaceae bacterium]